MTKDIEKKFLLAMAALAMLTAAACSTIAGAGRDIQDAGSAVTTAAEETQEDIQN